MKKITYLSLLIAVIALIGCEFIIHFGRQTSSGGLNFMSGDKGLYYLLLSLIYLSMTGALAAAFFGVVTLLIKQKSILDWVLLPVSVIPLALILVQMAK